MPGRCLDGYGHEGPERSFHGDTLYTDAASNRVYVECQTSMGAGKTVMGNAQFEQMCKNLADVTIKNYHSNNGVYNASVFVRIASPRINLRPSLGLEPSTKMQLLNAISK
jgi:hypothetical protein